MAVCSCLHNRPAQSSSQPSTLHSMGSQMKILHSEWSVSHQQAYSNAPPFSLMKQKIRGDCIIRFPPSRVLRFLPSAPGEICDVPPSITTMSHLARMPLLKLCDNVPGKDVYSNTTSVNNYEADSLSGAISWTGWRFRRCIYSVARTISDKKGSQRSKPFTADVSASCLQKFNERKESTWFSSTQSCVSLKTNISFGVIRSAMQMFHMIAS